MLYLQTKQYIHMYIYIALFGKDDIACFHFHKVLMYMRRKTIAGLVVNYGISNTMVLEIP